MDKQWNYGDILISNDGKSFVVYNHDNVEEFHGFETMCYVSDDSFSIITVADKDSYHFVTASEREQFHKLLHKHHKDWDVDRKQLVDWKWKPKAGENYFFISSRLSVEDTSNDGFDIDEARIRRGNCFRTREEAEAMAEKIKKLLKGE